MNSKKSMTTDQARSLSSSTAGMSMYMPVSSIVANPTTASTRPVSSPPGTTSALATSRNGLSSFYHLVSSATSSLRPRPGSWITKRPGESTLLERSSGSSTRNLSWQKLMAVNGCHNGRKYRIEARLEGADEKHKHVDSSPIDGLKP